MNKFVEGLEYLEARDLNLMLDGTLQYKFEGFEYDEGIFDVVVNDRLNAVAFGTDGTPFGTLKLDLRNFDILQDIKFFAIFCMSSAVSSKQIKLQADYKVYNEGDDISDFTFGTSVEEFNVPNTARTKKSIEFSTLKIPKEALTSQSDYILFDLSRLNSGLVGSNHTGNFELISLIAYQ